MMNRTLSVWISAAFLLVLGAAPSHAAEPAAKKLQVFILAGQSNMVGHASYITLPALLTAKEPGIGRVRDLVFKKGAIAVGDTRAQVGVRLQRDKINNDLREKKITGEGPIVAAKAKVAKLQEDLDVRTKKIIDSFKVSKRVYITSIADGHRRSGPLTVGFGSGNDRIGPELGFGLSIENKLDAPFLLIKTSWGGKSLNYNFRPPSAGPYELNDSEKASDKAEQIRKDAGLNYRMMNEAVHAVLKDLGKHHPEYDAAVGHEMAGFVWFQGFNDQFSDAFRNNYKSNMIHFIKDVRKEYKTPKMPFVIGVMGTGVTKEAVAKNVVSVAQREAAKAPEFKGNVATVESYIYYAVDAYELFRKGWVKHLHEFTLIGSDRPYHYMGSGKFFVRFGDALADSMAGLVK
jgi:alpha-galactosidase